MVRRVAVEHVQVERGEDGVGLRVPAGHLLFIRGSASAARASAYPVTSQMVAPAGMITGVNGRPRSQPGVHGL